MSAQDLYGLKIGYENPDAVNGVSINKIWTTIDFEAQTYKNVTLAGSTDLTVVNSYIGVDFSNGLDHNQLVLTDNAMAEMYGVSIDLTQMAEKEADRLPAFVTIEKTVTATPFSIGLDDTSAQNLGTINAVDGVYYTVTSTNTAGFNQFNVSG
jgi:hypothetical protein